MEMQGNAMTNQPPDKFTKLNVAPVSATSRKAIIKWEEQSRSLNIPLEQPRRANQPDED
jgi:hypothetical protein